MADRVKRASEEAIKADLRELTERTRKLRNELSEMIGRPAPSPARRFLHQQSWPKGQQPAVVADRRTRKGKMR
jgi:hypothetical protein